MSLRVRWWHATIGDMRRAHALVVLIVSSASPSCASAPSSSQAQTATRSDNVAPSVDARYRFDWSPPCRVPVRERTEKRGSAAVMSYVVDLRPSARGVLELHLTDFVFIEVNGRDVTRPAIREAMRPALEMIAAVPIMEISVEGEYLGVLDFERMLDAIETMLTQQGTSPEERARMRAMMSTPEMRWMMEEQIGGQYWRAWVESWIGWSLPPGGTHEKQAMLTLPGGGEGPVTIRTEHLGFVAGKARLRVTNEIRGPALIALIGPLLGQLARELNVDGPPNNLFGDGNRKTVVTVETDPVTLRPHHTRYEMILELEFSNGERREQREVRDVTWDWASAVGCGH